jgi:hypothetical protein
LRENQGIPAPLLALIADYTENRFAMQKKIQGAMIYPIILMLMSFAIVMGLMTYVVPDIVKTFDQSKDALPWITVALMKASDFIRVAWPFLLVGSVLGIGLLLRFLRTTAGHYAFDRLTLKLPLFGKLSRGINAARFASTLSILTQSGVPLVDALKIGAAVCASRKRPSGIPDHRVDQHLDGIPDVLDDHGLLAFLLRDDATFLTFGSNHLHLVGIPYLMDVAYHDANPVIKLVRRMCILAPATIPQREVLSSLSRHDRGVISPT